MPEQVLVADTAVTAKAVYNAAAQLPHTATRLTVMDVEHISINGMFKANVLSRSTLVYAFATDTLIPYILKIPLTPAAAKLEFAAWTCMTKAGQIPHLAGPLRIVNLKVWRCIVSCLQNGGA